MCTCLPHALASHVCDPCKALRPYLCLDLTRMTVYLHAQMAGVYANQEIVEKAIGVSSLGFAMVSVHLESKNLV